MRVAYLINQYPAVSHTFIRREIQALERLGVTIDRIALRGWDIPLVDADDMAERERTRYVLRGGAVAMLWATLETVFRHPVRFARAWRLAWRMSRDSDRGFPVHLAYLAEASVILRWLRESAATHLHAHFATNPAEVAMLTRELGGPRYSFTAHGSDIMDRPAQVGLRDTIGRSAFAVAVCSYGRSQLFKWIPHALWDRVHVIRCGLQPGYAAGSRSVVVGPRRLVCVGRLSKEKGQLLLVEAASRLAGQYPGEFEIVLAGDGPMRQEIEQLVTRQGLTARIRITGWLDATGVARELSRATSLVVPSLSEGLPVVIMEAMAHRLPVIAPYLAGIPELVVPGETGWLFPASDVQSMADAMQACFEVNGDVLAAMGDKAWDRVWAMHDIDNEAARLKDLMATVR